jgi:hypothetical protein
LPLRRSPQTFVTASLVAAIRVAEERGPPACSKETAPGEISAVLPRRRAIPEAGIAAFG